MSPQPPPYMSAPACPSWCGRLVQGGLDDLPADLRLDYDIRGRREPGVDVVRRQAPSPGMR